MYTRLAKDVQYRVEIFGEVCTFGINYLTTLCRVFLENFMSKTGHVVNKCRDFMDPEDFLPCPPKPCLDLILTRLIQTKLSHLITYVQF
jgi:hypothetical protein